MILNPIYYYSLLLFKRALLFCGFDSVIDQFIKGYFLRVLYCIYSEKKNMKKSSIILN